MVRKEGVPLHFSKSPFPHPPPHSAPAAVQEGAASSPLQLKSPGPFLQLWGFFFPCLALKMILVIRPPQVLASGMPLFFRKERNYQELQKGKLEPWHLEKNHIILPCMAFGGEKIIESVTLNTAPLCMTH